MDWFLYDKDPRQERVNTFFFPNIPLSQEKYSDSRYFMSVSLCTFNLRPVSSGSTAVIFTSNVMSEKLRRIAIFFMINSINPVL